MSLDLFIARWMHRDYPPRPVSADGLKEVEARFRFSFPADYRQDVLRSGLASPTSALLDAIIDGELDVEDLSDMLSPAEMVSQTEDWREMGLPHDMVAFATDCCGNLFCFRTDGGPAIFFFDHDFETTEETAPSFTAWINRFCAIGMK